MGGEGMKKRLIQTLSVVAAVILGAILVWPLSFDNVLTEDTKLWVLVTDLGIEDGKPKNNTTTYRFSPDSEGYLEIQQVLSGHTFHRSFRTFTGGTSISGSDAGFWLYLYSGEKHIITGGTGEIIVNGRVYRIGYWGGKKALSFMNEIRGVLSRQQQFIY